MFQDLDLGELRRMPRIGYYFRYPLPRDSFRELRVEDRLRGHYTAKPLYGRLTPEGRVDRSAGYSGDVAALFIPVEARRLEDVKVVLTRLDPQRITLPDGRRNWTAIWAAAEHGIRETLAAR
jgi:hypothetical protein